MKSLIGKIVYQEQFNTSSNDELNIVFKTNV